MLETKKLECDLCVVGGGMSGLCAAISAAREGLRVVLMHERPVLGGNASSEIRMWICGAKGKGNRETGILEEIALENLYRNPTKSYAVWDTVLYDFVRREKNITLLLNCTCMDAATETGDFADGRSLRIRTVTGYQMTTQRFFEVTARFFCDSSGDSILAPLTGAEFMLGREAAGDFGEGTDRTEADRRTMGMSCLIQGRETAEKIKYVPPEWSKKLTKDDFRDRNPDIYSDKENFWYLELGGDRDTIGDTEQLRDELVELAAGTWDYIKNSGEFNADCWELDFLGFLPGKRESRRMTGEYVLTQRDVSEGRVFDDEIAYGGWPLDDHFPGGFYHRGVPNTNFRTASPYSIPYRVLYSKNVENLFFAGRNISATHIAMSSTRVMATCGLLGQAVGKAAAVAVKHGLTPHGVYREKTRLLQQLLMDDDCYLPHVKRRISPLCKNAELSAGDSLRDGNDRGAAAGGRIEYRFDKARVSHVHIVFDSDLDRETLGVSECERTHSTRANTMLKSPQVGLPSTLCRGFELYGGLDGKETLLLRVENNRRRACRVAVDKPLDRLILVTLDGKGVISFDFD